MTNTKRPTNPESRRTGITSLITYAENEALHEDRAYGLLAEYVEKAGYDFDREQVTRRMDTAKIGQDGDTFPVLILTTYVG